MCIGIIYIRNINETNTFEYFSKSIIYTDNLSKSALSYYHHNN